MTAMILVLPLLSALVLLLAGDKLPRAAVMPVGLGGPALSALAAAAVCAPILSDPAAVVEAPLWTWASLPGLSLDFGLRVDALGAVMALVVTWVGALIVTYASEYMERDESYARFFGLLDLFLAMMLTLVLADSLLLLFVGWEGVGLCSYLLIGFWWQDARNGAAARKAFVVTRLGDVGLALGIYLLAASAGTLDLAALGAPGAVPAGVATAASLLLLLAAVGKSGQVPLHVWLPDAMAGPTPVSAMIHAATMVAAGVYLVARLHGLFDAGGTLPVVTAFGAVTLLVAGVAALGQVDIKRVLAFSTISQLGYMFVGLGAGAWDAAMFHFFTHAFFKALLFLAAGAIIEAAHHTQDLRKLGGLGPDARFLQVVFGVGCAALAALPGVTSGFWSKDLILAHAWASPTAGPAVAIAGTLGGLLTAMYSFRLYFLIFHGERRAGVEAHDTSGLRMRAPLAILAVGALVLGFLEAPGVLGFTGLLQPGHHLPEAVEAVEGLVMGLSAAAALVGAGAAWLVWGRPGATVASDSAAGRFLLGGLGFDDLYAALVQRPLLWVVGTNRRDPLELPYDGAADASRAGGLALTLLQTGSVGLYVLIAMIGAVALLLVAVPA
jgi:NADH-quinone oxidoreductase subunit L